MFDINYLEKNLQIPKDYFKGYGEYTIPMPSEILMFFRDKFGLHLVDIKDDIHYRYVLIFNFGEAVKMLIDGEAIEIQKDSFLIVQPYQYHKYYNQKQKNILLLFITFELKENLFLHQFRNTLFIYSHSFDDELKMLVEYYKSENELILPHYLSYFILKLFLGSSQFSIRNDTGKDSSIVHQICKEIYKDKTMTINLLSKKLTFSDRYLRRVFKNVMGITLGHYIQEIRIFEAMKYLATTARSITEISEICGYDSIYSFSRAFKNMVGTSPKEFRNKSLMPNGQAGNE